MKRIRSTAANVLSKIVDLDENQILSAMKLPPNPDMGDIAFPCFMLAKTLRKSPADIADSLCEEIELPEIFSEVRSQGPFLNFAVNPAVMADQLLNEIHSLGSEYGSSPCGTGRKVLIEYSSPNIAKPMGIHHIRTTMIGNSLAHIYAKNGFECIRMNYVGDWGTSFGKLIYALKNWGQGKEHYTTLELNELYVRFCNEAEKDPELEDKARAEFSALEKGEKEATVAWNTIKQESIRQFESVYAKLGVEFDVYTGESDYYRSAEDVIEKARKADITQESDSALVVPMEDGPPCILLKKDGSTIYGVRDLAAAMDRKEKYGFDKMLYVVAHSQALHFRQVFTVLKKMGMDWAKSCEHVPFGLISFNDAKMSTRKGNILYLNQVLDEAFERVKDKVRESAPHLLEKEDVLRMVATGAVVFADLSSKRMKDVTFSWEEILNFEGETGPYLQYTHARCKSIIRKAGSVPAQPSDLSCIQSRSEREILKKLDAFPDAVEKACAENEPSIISSSLLDIAAVFNRFYHAEKVIQENQALQDARLIMVECVATVLKEGLRLIGIQAPQEM